MIRTGEDQRASIRCGCEAHVNRVRVMLDAFAMARGHLGARLILGLEVGLSAGGQAGPVHSVSLLVVDRVSWPIVDLRIDWHKADPIGALRVAWNIYAPQIEGYVTRALNPTQGPRLRRAGGGDICRNKTLLS